MSSQRAAPLHRLLIAFGVALSASACGAGADDLSHDSTGAHEAETATLRSELATDPNQYIFAVRRINATTYGINPVGDYSALCPDGIYRTECQVSRLRLTDTGLSTTRQNQLLTRIASEPAAESSASVLFKGSLVNVRDNRTNPPTNYFEFRATAAYWAPAVRAHAGTFSYVAGGVQSNGYQPAKGVNTDLAPRGGGLNLTYQVLFNWVGPSLERPTSYPADSFVTVVTYRPLPGAGSLGPFVFDVDQRFVRVTN